MKCSATASGAAASPYIMCIKQTVLACKTKLLERLSVCLAGLFNELVGGKSEVIVGDAQAGCAAS